MNKQKTGIMKTYQCRYCGRTHTTAGLPPIGGQCPARKKPKAGFAPHIWIKIR